MQSRKETRRTFLKTAAFSASALAFGNIAFAKPEPWKVAIVQDTSIKTLGGHGLETAFYGLPNVEIVAHIDSNEKDIEKRMAITHAKKHYRSLEEMFKQTVPDIVVLTCRLPETHLPAIRILAEKGCNIYCEKPLVSSLHDADEIVKIVKKHNIKLTVAHPRRYDLGYRTMKKLIESGKIGTPLTIHGFSKNDHRGGGEDMLVLGTHILDLFLFMFGAPANVYGEVYVDGKPFKDQPLTKTVEPIGPTAGDEIFATFRFPNGVHGVYGSRRKLYSYEKKDYPMGIAVMGTSGMLSYHFSDAHPEQQPLRFNNHPTSPARTSFAETIELIEDREIPGAVPLEKAFGSVKKMNMGAIFASARRYAVWDLMQAIKEDRQPVCNAFEAQKVMEMIYGVYTSHLQNKPIEFPLKDRSHPLTKFQKNV
ncbi:MAG: Gfo/Idh/MocA family oxidoreductase [Planctomycetia bacterium]|nr:Gfo/Idh/MocA family oxidoreductase [Planctomycetia bacterium]